MSCVIALIPIVVPLLLASTLVAMYLSSSTTLTLAASISLRMLLILSATVLLGALNSTLYLDSVSPECEPILASIASSAAVALLTSAVNALALAMSVSLSVKVLSLPSSWTTPTSICAVLPETSESKLSTNC